VTHPPTAKGVAAFLLGVWIALTVAESPLHALAGSQPTLHERVNEVRREHHLKALRPSDELARVALAHAEEMASGGYLDHVNRAGRNPLERVQGAGVEGFRLLAENIGSSNVGDDRIPAVIEAWLGSPIHRNNLLNPAFNTSGSGIVRSPSGETVVVQLYATFPLPQEKPEQSE